jgi:nitrate/TMAO reductase-like tetraheme cytochrome c subunit
MRRLLTLICLLCLVSAAEGAWTDLLQQNFPKTPWETRPAIERTVCLDCHTSDLMQKKYRAIPGQWRKSIHYRNDVSCQSCHGGDPKDAARSMLPAAGFVGVPKPKQIPEFCGKCHIGIKDDYLASGHAKALMTTGRGPNCITCHRSHDIQKANINIIREGLCGICHSYDRAQEMKAALFGTEQKMNEISRNLKTLKAGLIATQNEEKVLFRTQAEYRTLFHTVDVKMVQAKTGEFSKKLAVIAQGVQKGFGELEFRQNFAILIMLIFVGLAITIFFLGRRPE